jgi:hypothetical protein
MPPNTIKVCRPGVFGNPFAIGPDRTQEAAVDCFRQWLVGNSCKEFEPERRQAILSRVSELRGKNLACWCKAGTPCHADVLLALANR